MNPIISILICLVLTGTVALGQSKPEISVNRLSDKTILLNLDMSEPHNVIAINTTEGIVVIDSEISPAIAKKMREKIIETFGHEKFRYLINTHVHWDHAFGNSAFSDATLIGHTSCTKVIKGFPLRASRTAERMPAIIKSLTSRLETVEPGSREAIQLRENITYYQLCLEGISGDFFAPMPEITFTDELTLFLDDMTLVIKWFGNAHSNSDLLIYSPQEKFLATGDLFVPMMNPPYLNSDNVENLEGYIAALEPYFLSDTVLKTVIPGHANGLDPSSLNEIVTYFKEEQTRIEGKENAFPVFETMVQEKGSQEAIDILMGMVKQEKKYFILEGDLVGTGYENLNFKQDTVSAVRIFTLLSEQFPDSWNAWDCLGEGYMTAGDNEQAILCYEKSLALNPDNDNARKQIERMK